MRNCTEMFEVQS